VTAGSPTRITCSPTASERCCGWSPKVVRTRKSRRYSVDLGIATIETHRAHLMEKLNLHNTAEIVLYAVRKGIIV